MKERLVRLPAFGGGVIVKMKRSPRLEMMGLHPGTTVACTYKSRGIIVLEIGHRLIALRRKELEHIWVDY